MRKLIHTVLLTSIITGSCKDENKYRWTEIDINISSLTAEEFPDSIHFKVAGGKSGLAFSNNSDGNVEIDDYIVDGHYHGGFIAKSHFGWQYRLTLDETLRDSFYSIPSYPTYIDVQKRQLNTFDYQICKKYPLNIKSYLSSCTGTGDRIKFILKHKLYEPHIDITQNSEDWESGSYFTSMSGCDTNVRNYFYPAGLYEVGVKTIIQGTETGYFNFDYEVFKDSTNLLELYY